MGYNTTVLILNDGLDQIEKHPEEFVAGIVEKMHGGGTVGVGCHANPVEVMPTQHADVYRLYSTHANMILELSPYSRATLDLAKRMPDLVQSDINRARDLLDSLEATITKENQNQ